MKKGFTLVELLAVIVILAILALIAVPIVTNIIDKAERDSELMSAKMYIDGVNKSILTYNISNKLKDATCEVQSDGNLDCDGTTIQVDVQNTIATGGTITIENRKVSKVQNLKVGEKYYTTNENGELIGSETLTLPSLSVTPATAETKTTGNVPAGNYAAGDEYIINLGGEDRVFFVLEDGDNTTLTKGTTGTAGPGEVSLIMNMNYIDDEVYEEERWCDPNGDNPDDNTCNHDNLDPLVSHIQEIFGNDVTVSLPSYDQIYKAAGNKESGLPTWLYDYLDGTEHSVSGLNGYWTSTAASSNSAAHGIGCAGGIGEYFVNQDFYGIRPVITISKSLMN
jgi:type IV pilus assembly protein PilA